MRIVTIIFMLLLLGCADEPKEPLRLKDQKQQKSRELYSEGQEAHLRR
jgi:hypothetical protein